MSGDQVRPARAAVWRAARRWRRRAPCSPARTRKRCATAAHLASSSTSSTQARRQCRQFLGSASMPAAWRLTGQNSVIVVPLPALSSVTAPMDCRLANRKPWPGQAGAAAGLLAGEEGSKARSASPPRSCRCRCRRPRWRRKVPPSASASSRGRSGERAGTSRQANHSSPPSGMASRVDGDVQQGRPQLRGVGQHGRAIGRRVDLDADALVERVRRSITSASAAQHQGAVQRRRLSTWRREKASSLPVSSGAAPAGARGRADELLRERIGGDRARVFEHLQVVRDHRQQVVEVVRDAAGELAHASSRCEW